MFDAEHVLLVNAHYLLGRKTEAVVIDGVLEFF